MTKKRLILEDGSVFEGEGFGYDKEVIGELVFNTGMSGYQESITDQSYAGQLLTFTYPLIGNYGINYDNYESLNPSCVGVIVHEWARRPSHWKSQMNLDTFLKQKKIPGLAGIDTRLLTKKIRKHGVMKAYLTSKEEPLSDLLAVLRNTELDQKLIQKVSTQAAYPIPGQGYRVIVMDFGLKHSILAELSKRNCQVTVVPYDTSLEEITALAPDGIVLSNGPGDPDDLPEALDTIRELEKRYPLFGICMGHQLFSKANGAKTYKMKFGHRGFNHAVRELATGQINFTSQNHGYAVSREDLPADLEITHEEINDHTVEGLRHKKYPAFSVQYHPDACPGPHDADYLFDSFLKLIEESKQTK
ncbi:MULTISPECIES: carbamoyl phosphate synthase small subunit [Aerococcus]|uniref:carbamoyl phosphate synthase small subunit n=1 Tax=Aerococcus TaxID=1375 RepID=UPI000DCEAEE4|nr:carbamoyl phosphate synthase small subunit [Aerococcus urinae]MDL5183621.1 carbamoyl phosphate synthase small subunit [Aerococcus mictus]MDK6375869.1 carbamoyl phosphate synthase small subunit [Aerococcus urinae]MDK6421426.1 carbamoyl phosphate synthase small subunit [Aerococcus urinae]MDK8075829.1 carbamoyl phosphate synthase small subunit [Aerococcus urinae]MDK8085197.1 carbamoyl phosphate synthase small subunit [Aerococcus urinae]